MKIKLSFKNPDAVSEALQNIEDEERQEQIRDELGTFVKYGEYLRVVYDTETKTIEVLKN